MARRALKTLLRWRAEYNRLDLPGRSASLSFFTVISIFPLLLILITVSGYFYPGGVVANEIARLVDDFFPIHNEWILKNLEALFTKRRTFEWMGWIGLLISARALFVHLEKNVNALIEAERRRSYIFTRLLFVVWLLGILIVLFTPLFLGTILKILSYFDLEVPKAVASRGVFLLSAFLLFLLVALLLPRERLKRQRLLSGALFFSLALEGGKMLFRWFAGRNLVKYNLVYGSLASMVLGAVWIFYFYHMFLFFIYWMGRGRFQVTPVTPGGRIRNDPELSRPH